MKAILVNNDRSLIWDDVPNPILGDDDCLIKIEAAALNRADLMQREGDYPPPPGCPEWMGLEIAGTIVEIADGAKEKSNWKVGDKSFEDAALFHIATFPYCYFSFSSDSQMPS